MENKKTRRIGTRLAVFGCALALVTMAGVGMTFAKYTKTSNTTETGTVAAFGVTLTNSPNMFAPTYAKDDATATTIGNDSVSSAAQTQIDMLAPGTTGNNTADSLKVEINGNEVAVAVEFKFSITKANWTVDSVAYEPVTFTITKVVTSTSGSTAGTYVLKSDSTWSSTSTDAATFTMADIATGITVVDNYAVNQNTTKADYKISWNWTFEASKYLVTTAIAATDYLSETGDAIAAGTIIDATTYGLLKTTSQNKCITTDAADTKLGEAATKATITASSTLTATQID